MQDSNILKYPFAIEIKYNTSRLILSEKINLGPSGFSIKKKPPSIDKIKGG
jgi:hypothetical protein